MASPHRPFWFLTHPLGPTVTSPGPAEDLIALDHLSQGRAFTILALGYRPIEYELHGVDYARRGQIADEKLEALLEALRDAAAGERSPRITPPPFSPNGPMLAWGGGTKAAARRAGRGCGGGEHAGTAS